MRGSIGRTLSRPIPVSFSNATRQCPIPFSTSSSSSGGGGGRGRGRGSGSTPFDFTAPGKPAPDESNSKTDSTPPGVGLGHGHGRGRPLPSSPTLPNFSSFISSIKPPSSGRGHPVPPPPDSAPKQPIFFKKEDGPGPAHVSDAAESFPDRNLPPSILPGLTGSGRGQPLKQPVPEAPHVEENRHTRTQKSQVQAQSQPLDEGRRAPRMTREEAVKNAVNILSRGGGGEVEESGGGAGRGRGRGGFRGRGGPGWGRGRGLFRGRGRGRFGDSKEDGYGAGLYLGDNADGENLAQKLGVETMNQLVEGFEEITGDVLPSPTEDAILDAMDMNYSIECEPEYLMGEFDQNPDIDEKPPIPLRDALEKMKPFLMAYEGIQNQEEWEEIMKETMEKVPLFKEIVDYYSGPDRVTAKQQQQELERVAETVPTSAPDSVKRFADRAVLSLQSNPGWGFDKKCQFMDKLVREVSHHYKMTC